MSGTQVNLSTLPKDVLVDMFSVHTPYLHMWPILRLVCRRFAAIFRSRFASANLLRLAAYLGDAPAIKFVYCQGVSISADLYVWAALGGRAGVLEQLHDHLHVKMCVSGYCYHISVDRYAANSRDVRTMRWAATQFKACARFNATDVGKGCCSLERLVRVCPASEFEVYLDQRRLVKNFARYYRNDAGYMTRRLFSMYVSEEFARLVRVKNYCKMLGVGTNLVPRPVAGRLLEVAAGVNSHPSFQTILSVLYSTSPQESVTAALGYEWSGIEEVDSFFLELAVYKARFTNITFENLTARRLLSYATLPETRPEFFEDLAKIASECRGTSAALWLDPRSVATQRSGHLHPAVDFIVKRVCSGGSLAALAWLMPDLKRYIDAMQGRTNPGLIKFLVHSESCSKEAGVAMLLDMNEVQSLEVLLSAGHPVLECQRLFNVALWNRKWLTAAWLYHNRIYDEESAKSAYTAGPPALLGKCRRFLYLHTNLPVPAGVRPEDFVPSHQIGLRGSAPSRAYVPLLIKAGEALFSELP